VALLTTLAGVA